MNRWWTARTEWFAAVSFLLGCTASSSNHFEGAWRGADGPESTEGADTAPDAAGLRAPVLERSAFVRAVLERNRSIEASRQAWRAAAARARGSGSLDDPTLTADVAPLSIASRSARLGWDAAVVQRLPWPGKLSLDETVARAEAEAARSDFEATRRDLALTASQLYDDYYVDARAIDINAHHVELMRALQAAATAQYETGRGSAQDALQAEFELAHMEHDALVLGTRRDVTAAQMNELLHRPPEAPLPPAPAELPAPKSPDVASVAHLESEAIDQRPEIAAARHHARAAAARVERAHRELFPDLAVQTGYSAMWDTPEHRWTVGLSVTLPVQTGRRGAAIDEAEAVRAQHEAEAERLGDAARTESVVAMKQLDESLHVLHLYEERLLPAARREVDAARAAYTASQAPFIAVVDAEKNLRGVELDRQMARAEWDRRRARLDRALGRVPGLDEAEVTP